MLTRYTYRKYENSGNLNQILLHPPDNLSSIFCHAHVSRAWWTSFTGHVAVAEPSPAVVVATWLEGHTRGTASVVTPPTARLGHQDDAHFGLLKHIFIIPCPRNCPIGPKGPYPSQPTKSVAKHLAEKMSFKTAHIQPTLSPRSAHIRDTSNRVQIDTTCWIINSDQITSH